MSKRKKNYVKKNKRRWVENRRKFLLLKIDESELAFFVLNKFFKFLEN